MPCMTRSQACGSEEAVVDRRSIVTTALDLMGMALVVAGVALIFVPAAVILAGAGLLVLSWRLS